MSNKIILLDKHKKQKLMQILSIIIMNLLKSPNNRKIKLFLKKVFKNKIPSYLKTYIKSKKNEMIFLIKYQNKFSYTINILKLFSSLFIFKKKINFK
jgi:NAD-specific glutamate dehydrogenase